MKPTDHIGEEADMRHDVMMDVAAESIDSCETLEDFWKIMEKENTAWALNDRLSSLNPKDDPNSLSII